jgi:hypothetical protein
MAYLPFINDELLKQFTKEVLDKALLAYEGADNKLHSNIIDPFSALFDSMRQGISVGEWLEQERSRQVQKTLQNAVGDFHQNILGSIDGWINPGRGGGYDIINHDKKILAEIKNKFNTMNSSASESTYKKLVRYLEGDYAGYVSYVVFIVPRLPTDYDSPWSPNHTTMPLRDDVRKADGESFYSLVTGYDDALEMLFNCLPDVVSSDLTSITLNEKDRLLLKEFFIKAYK